MKVFVIVVRREGDLKHRLVKKNKDVRNKEERGSFRKLQKPIVVLKN